MELFTFTPVWTVSPVYGIGLDIDIAAKQVVRVNLAFNSFKSIFVCPVRANLSYFAIFRYKIDIHAAS